MKPEFTTSLKLLKTLQQELPLKARPFDGLARKTGLTTPALIAKMKRLKESGALRRYGLVIHHRKTGYAFNGMVAVEADKSAIKKLVGRLLKEPAVTHAYERPPFPDWPFGLYFMIHAKTKKANSIAIARLFEGIDIKRKRVLYSTREFKKTSFRL